MPTIGTAVGIESGCAVGYVIGGIGSVLWFNRSLGVVEFASGGRGSFAEATPGGSLSRVVVVIAVRGGVC